VSEARLHILNKLKPYLSFRLQTQCKDLKQQTVELKSNMTNLLKQMSENSYHLQANERRLLVKNSEIADLKKDCDELRLNLSTKSEELTKLEAHNKENVRTRLLST